LRSTIKWNFDKLEEYYKNEEFIIDVDARVKLTINFTPEKFVENFEHLNNTCGTNTMHAGAVSLMRLMSLMLFKSFFKNDDEDKTIRAHEFAWSTKIVQVVDHLVTALAST
jgi:hypothetical protein